MHSQPSTPNESRKSFSSNPLRQKMFKTNLLISTVHGFQASLLLISRGETAATQPDVDFMMRYRPAGRFVIEPSAPSALTIAQTVALQTSDRAAESSGIPSAAVKSKNGDPAEVKGSKVEPVSFRPGRLDARVDVDTPTGVRPADADLTLDALLERQRRVPLPDIDGFRSRGSRVGQTAFEGRCQRSYRPWALAGGVGSVNAYGLYTRRGAPAPRASVRPAVRSAARAPSP